MLFSDNKLILEELLNNLFYIAEADGNISINEIEVLKSISQSFHLNENDFQRIFNMRLNNKESDPYKVLGVNRDDSESDIRKRVLREEQEKRDEVARLSRLQNRDKEIGTHYEMMHQRLMGNR